MSLGLYSGGSFSASAPPLVFRLPFRLQLSAAVTPMLLSKELSSSSHGYSDSFSWTLALWRGNYGHQRSVLRGGILSLSIIFSVQVWQWRILTIKKETLYEKSNIISFLYLRNWNNLNQRTSTSLFFSGFLWFSFTLFASKCHMIPGCFGS